ncbi:4590_t:CDS:2, partial [Gigaspora rosea]
KDTSSPQEKLKTGAKLMLVEKTLSLLVTTFGIVVESSHLVTLFELLHPAILWRRFGRESVWNYL